MVFPTGKTDAVVLVLVLPLLAVGVGLGILIGHRVGRPDRSAVVDVDPSWEPALDVVLNLLPIGVVLGNVAGRVTLRNATADVLVDSWDDGVLGRAVIERLQQAVSAARTDHVDNDRIRVPVPLPRIFEVTGQPLVVEGDVAGALVVFHDVTDQIRLDTVHRDFVANVSHELKTPTGAISLLAEALEGEKDPDVVARLTGHIGTESRRLADLVEDLLDLRRAEEGETDPTDRVTWVNLTDVAREVVERVEILAGRQGVSLALEAPTVLAVSGSRTQLVSMLRNLVENAVKYSDAGGSVEVMVRSESSGDGSEPKAIIEVRDDGIGIPVRDNERVFERFYRVDRARHRDTGGSGLGLSIVRNVVQSHQGAVDLETVEGRGTTVIVRLPAYPTTIGLAGADGGIS